MTRWVIYQIEQRKMEVLSLATRDAENLDIELHLAQQHKPRPRGQRETSPRDFILAQAEELYDFIRELWWREYGKKNRKQINQPSAVDIVAEYFGFDDETTQLFLEYTEETTHKLADRISKTPKKKRGFVAR